MWKYLCMLCVYHLYVYVTLWILMTHINIEKIQENFASLKLGLTLVTHFYQLLSEEKLRAKIRTFWPVFIIQCPWESRVNGLWFSFRSLCSSFSTNRFSVYTQFHIISRFRYR